MHPEQLEFGELTINGLLWQPLQTVTRELKEKGDDEVIVSLRMPWTTLNDIAQRALAGW